MQITRFKTGSKGTYISIFDTKYSKYGGHWQTFGAVVNFIIYNLSAHRMWFEDFGVGVFPKSNMFGYSCMYYDGYNHSLWLGAFHFGWGGGPFLFGDVDLLYDTADRKVTKKC